MAEKQELQGIADRLNGELAERRRDYTGHISHLAAELLEEANRDAGGFGVEGELDGERGVNIQYVNMGDPYRQTVVYDGAKNQFLAAAWGDVVEEQERENARGERGQLNLPELAARLTSERRDEDLWNANHPYLTQEEFMEELREELRGDSVSEILDAERDIRILFVDRGYPLQETIVYDAVNDEFIADSPSQVFEAKQREQDGFLARLGVAASRLNRELYQADDRGLLDIGRTYTIRNMLRWAVKGMSASGLGRQQDENGGADVEYVDFGAWRNITLLYDGEAGRFSVGNARELIREKLAREAQLQEKTETSPDETEREAREAKIAEIRDAVKDGDSVYIGERQYYVYGTNNFFVNMYPAEELDALPDVMDFFGNDIQYEKYELLREPDAIRSAVWRNNYPVTDCFLDIEDFREAVIGSTRNSAIIEKMGLPAQERDDPIIPLIQTNGSPYYTVGDRVFLENDRECLVKAVADRHVWYEEITGETEMTDADKKRPVRIPRVDFESQFFSNPLNNEAILRGREIERTGAKQTISAVNLPALAERLNGELGDRKSWEAAHPGKTIRDWLDDIADEIKCESHGPLGELSKGTDLWRINLRGRDESLFYDYTDRKFMYGKTADVLKQKEEMERRQRLEHAERLAEEAELEGPPPERDVSPHESQSQISGDLPVFYGSPEEDSDAFWDSHGRNMECANALRNAFRRHFDGKRMNTEAVIGDIKEFSDERISLVLANTMRTREGDGRFSPANRKWQESVTLPESFHKYYTAVDSHSTLVDHLIATLRERRTPDHRAVGTTDPDAAYWAHYRDISAKSSGDLDYSRIDAKIGVRMRVTDHTPDQIQSAIENNAPAMRGETMDAAAFDAKYKNRDWRGYAAETTENYVFGARGAIQYEKALSDRPLYMRIEGRNLQEEDRIRRESERQDKEQSRGR